MMKRRICWPDPDATCLEGGCLYCNDNPFRSVSSIRRWVNTQGRLLNRVNHGTQDALVAFRWGEDHNWGNAEVTE